MKQLSLLLDFDSEDIIDDNKLYDSHKKDFLKKINFKEPNIELYNTLYDSENLNISEINYYLIYLNKKTNKILSLKKGDSIFLDGFDYFDYKFIDMNSISISDELSYNTPYSSFLKTLLVLGYLNNKNGESNLFNFKEVNSRTLTKLMLEDFLKNINKEDKINAILLTNIYIDTIINDFFHNESVQKKLNINKEKINKETIINKLKIDFNLFNFHFYNEDIFNIQKSIVFKNQPSDFLLDKFKHIKKYSFSENKELINNNEVLYTLSLIYKTLENLLEYKAKLNKIFSKYLVKSYYYAGKPRISIDLKKENIKPILKSVFDINELNLIKNKNLLLPSNLIDDKTTLLKSDSNVVRKESNIAIFIQEVNKTNPLYKGGMDEKIKNTIGKKQDFMFIQDKNLIINVKNTLDNKFPWMYQVNKEIVQNLIFNFKSERHIYLKPIIIEGKPGIGKSYYMSTLANLLNLPYVSYKASGRTEFLDFTGNSSNWGDSKPSLMTNLILNYNILNPLVIVDELDKTLSNKNGDLQSSLLSLIDKNEAKQYFDPYLSHNVDFSHINWIFTINDKSKINSFLLDRINVIKVEEPKEENFDLVYNNIIQEFSEQENINIDEILKIGIPKDKIFNEFRMNYSLRKMKDNIHNFINNYYYNDFFDIKEKPEIKLC